MEFTTTNGSFLNKALRHLKVKYFGGDTHDTLLLSPFGFESNPVAGQRCVKSKTGNDNTQVIVGFVVKENKAETGETRIFATDANGNEVGDIHIKNDGTIEFLGDGNYLTKFNELKTAFNELQGKYNATAASLTGLGISAAQSTANIDSAKAEKLKTT